MTSRKEFEKWYAPHTTWYPLTKADNHPRLANDAYLYDRPQNMWDCWQACTALHESEIVAKDKEISELKNALINANNLLTKFNNKDTERLEQLATLELDNKRLREALEYYAETAHIYDKQMFSYYDHRTKAKDAISTQPSTKSIDEYWNSAVEACAELVYASNCLSSALTDIEKLKKEV